MERYILLTDILERTRKMEFDKGSAFTMSDIPIEDFQEVYGPVVGRILKWPIPHYLFDWGPTKQEWKTEIMAQLDLINIRPYN